MAAINCRKMSFDKRREFPAAILWGKYILRQFVYFFRAHSVSRTDPEVGDFAFIRISQDRLTG